MATASVATQAVQPDIGYTPDFAKYKARTQRRLATEKLELQGLPAGFPSQLESDFVWDGQTVHNNYDWVFQLSDREVVEVENALNHFKCPFPLLLSNRSLIVRACRLTGHRL